MSATTTDGVDRSEGATGATAPTSGDAPARTGRRLPTINTVVALALALVGLRIGLVPLHDNSFLTHLATGRLILDDGAIPRADPYSFTAFGDPWTVQSWGASVIYAGTERVFGLAGIRLLVGVCAALIAVLAWRLSAPAERLVGRLVLAVLALAVGANFWVERPLIFGLLFFALVLMAAEDRLDARWLLPLMWLWVNIHGSFPLGLAALGAMAVGRWFDRESPRVELRALAWAAGGTLLASINPLGPKLLVFPLQLVQRREAFARIVEWQPPTWTSWGQRFFAIQLLLAVVVLLVRNRRWRTALPLLAFGGAALMSMRNIPQASLALIPGMALGLAGLGSIDGTRRSAILRPVVVALVTLGILVTAASMTGPDTDLTGYPTASLRWMRQEEMLDLDDRVVSRDFVGNYLHYRYGPGEVRTYIDDRVDMYPVALIRDYSSLLDRDGPYQAVLDRARPTAVLWERDSPLGRWLEASSRWRVVHRDADWLVAVPEA